jgi:hypothetical protein
LSRSQAKQSICYWDTYRRLQEAAFVIKIGKEHVSKQRFLSLHNSYGLNEVQTMPPYILLHILLHIIRLTIWITHTNILNNNRNKIMIVLFDGLRLRHTPFTQCAYVDHLRVISA